MKLSTKGRYGVRLMLDLAQHYGQSPVVLKDISKRQDVSEKYLWQLVPPLKNAGLITSTRGSKGGYTLAKSPEKIDLEEIVSLLEGPICFVDCVDEPSACKRISSCATSDVWRGMAVIIKKYLSGITLRDLVEKQINKGKALNYSI